MNKEESKIYNDLQIKLLQCKYYEDTKYIPLYYLEDQKMKINSNQSKLHVGLINIPCSGFGDIVNCSIFYQYLKDWYPNIKVSICTPEIEKFKSLKIKGLKFIELKSKLIESVDGKPLTILKDFDWRLPKDVIDLKQYKQSFDNKLKMVA